VNRRSRAGRAKIDKGKKHNEVSGRVTGPVVQTAVHYGDVYFEQAATSDITVSWQLPVTVTHFTGRVLELAKLGGLVAADGENGSSTIFVIDGTAGIGKTTLALYWGHRMRGRFPDGQLYVDLRGFDPDAEPMSSHVALRHLLDGLGVPPEKVPASMDACAALFRTATHDRRMLIVLDNARSSRQSLPLLPGGSACLTLVTSRNRLDELVVQGARRIALDFLEKPEAVDLLTSFLGERRVEDEPSAVREIIDRCACLPLALAIVGARAAGDPAVSLTAVAEELRDEQNCLDRFDVGDGGGLRAVFSWSYRALPGEAKRMFRLLSLPAGNDIDIDAAAVLAGLPVHGASRLLDELSRMHLLERYIRNRYRFHDLMRVYAAECAEADESAAKCEVALRRLFDWYLFNSSNADSYLSSHRWSIDLSTLRLAGAPRDIGDYRQAIEWFSAESANLLPAVKVSLNRKLYDHAWRLPCVMHTYLEFRGRWQDCVDVQKVALVAAWRAGSREAQALVARNLGHAYTLNRRYQDAVAYYEIALRLCHELGNGLGQAYIHSNLGNLYDLLREYDVGLTHAEQALKMFRDADDHMGEASMLDQVGWLLGRVMSSV